MRAIILRARAQECVCAHALLSPVARRIHVAGSLKEANAQCPKCLPKQPQEPRAYIRPTSTTMRARSSNVFVCSTLRPILERWPLLLQLGCAWLSASGRRCKHKHTRSLSHELPVAFYLLPVLVHRPRLSLYLSLKPSLINHCYTKPSARSLPIRLRNSNNIDNNYCY